MTDREKFIVDFMEHNEKSLAGSLIRSAIEFIDTFGKNEKVKYIVPYAFNNGNFGFLYLPDMDIKEIEEKTKKLADYRKIYNEGEFAEAKEWLFDRLRNIAQTMTDAQTEFIKLGLEEFKN